MRVIGFLGIIIFLCSGVFAVSGVSPANYEFNFEPGLTEEVVFNFIIEGGSEDLYIEGGLAEYVSLDKESVSGSERVSVLLNLPQEIDSPGINYIKVRAGDVAGFIGVRVPYPSKYVDVGLNAPNANVGEDVLFELEMFGKGAEPTVVSPRIEILKDSEILDDIKLDDIEILSGDKKIINVSFGTDNYSVGDYLAVAYLSYDDRVVSVENPFSLGIFSVKVVDYTKSVRENKIENFEIVVDSLWNNNIKNISANVSVVKFPLASFTTSTLNLPAWGTIVLSGFLDTSLIGDDNFDVEIILNYDNEVASEVVGVDLIRGFDYVLLIIVLIIVIILALLIWRIFVFIKKIKKHRVK